MKRLIPLAVIASLAVAACGSSHKTTTNTTTATTAPSLSTGNPTSAVALSEDGSSLLYPFLQTLETPLHTAFSNVTLNPAAGGSGKGISDAIAGNVDMGGSDAYLSSSDISANPGLLNIPIAVSSQAVNYNLPGISNLKLSGNVLAEIYQGKITKWNDPAITGLNQGVNLPDKTIVPIHRVDSSGDTFLFTSFLSATNSQWATSPGYDTILTNWPTVTGELTASGNPGMVQRAQSTPDSIAYVGISAEATAQAAGLGEAELENQAGNFEQSSPTTVDAAVSAGSGNVPSNLATSLINESGTDSYPIVNFEYIVVKSTQSSATTAQAIRDFLTFAISPTGGSTPTLLAKDQFEALPTSVISKVDSAIASITG